MKITKLEIPPTKKSDVLSCRFYQPESHEQHGPLILMVHPYSKMGGSGTYMHPLALLLTKKGKYKCLTFDCRGVGNSGGSSSFTGVSEIDDVKSIVDFLEKSGEKEIILLGSSAGSAIAGSALDYSDAVKGYIGIGFVCGFLIRQIFGSHIPTLSNSPKPKLFVHGSRDGFTSVSSVESYMKKMKGSNNLEVIEGAGHFDLEGEKYNPELLLAVFGFLETFL